MSINYSKKSLQIWCFILNASYQLFSRQSFVPKATTLIEKISMTVYFENLTKFGHKFGYSLKL